MHRFRPAALLLSLLVLQGGPVPAAHAAARTNTRAPATRTGITGAPKKVGATKGTAKKAAAKKVTQQVQETAVATADETATPSKPGALIQRPFRPGKKTRLPESWTIAENEYLNPEEYSDLKGGVMELLKRYPPNKYFFVGLGRDGAPVIAFLQALGGKNVAVNLPGTSNIGWNGVVKPKVVAQHIEAAIPKSILTGKRRLVLLDVTSSGKTPALFGPYMDKYLKAHGGKATSLKVGFWSSDLKEGIYGEQLTDWIDTSQWSDFDEYYGGKYEGTWTPQAGGYGIAEHQRHDMTTGSPPKKTSPNYAAFKKALLARMEQDKALDTFLAKLPGAGEQLAPEAPPPPPTPWKPAIALTVKPAPLKATPAMSIKNPRFKEQTEKLAKLEERNAKRIAKGKEPKVKESVLEPKTFDYLAAGEYGQIRDAALMMMQRHNPQTSYFVGVGRSSTALVAFMEGLGNDVATYLPADGITKVAEDQATPDALDYQTKQKIFALFETFIPEKARNGTRKIVLFQQSETGVSLPYMQALLEEWLAEDGSETKVTNVALANEKPKGVGEHLNISQAKELQQLGSGKYYAVAPYGYFRPGKNEQTEVVVSEGKAAKRSASYAKFQAAMKSIMSQDAVVQAALPSLTASPK